MYILSLSNNSVVPRIHAFVNSFIHRWIDPCIQPFTSTLHTCIHQFNNLTIHRIHSFNRSRYRHMNLGMAIPLATTTIMVTHRPRHFPPYHSRPVPTQIYAHAHQLHDPDIRLQSPTTSHANTYHHISPLTGSGPCRSSPRGQHRHFSHSRIHQFIDHSIGSFLHFSICTCTHAPCM